MCHMLSKTLKLETETTVEIGTMPCKNVPETESSEGRGGYRYLIQSKKKKNQYKFENFVLYFFNRIKVFVCFYSGYETITSKISAGKKLSDKEIFLHNHKINHKKEKERNNKRN